MAYAEREGGSLSMDSLGTVLDALPSQTQCAIILSDCSGGNIRYISPRIHSLIGARNDIVLGMPYRSFLKALQPSASQVAELTSGDGKRDVEQIAKKLNHLTLYSVMEHCEVVEGTVPANVGVAVLPITMGEGEIFTCKLIMTRVQHPEHGMVSLTLLYDISAHLAVEHLLSIASTGEYFQVMRREKVDARSDSFCAYLRRLGASVLKEFGGMMASAQHTGDEGRTSPSSETRKPSKIARDAAVEKTAAASATSTEDEIEQALVEVDEVDLSPEHQASVRKRQDRRLKSWGSNSGDYLASRGHTKAGPASVR